MNNREETKAYFEYIKCRLKNKVIESTVYVNEVYISETIVHRKIDEDYLRELCDNENIKMWYSSLNDRAGMMNWNPSKDIIHFSQKTPEIIIKYNLQLKLIRRVG